MVQGKDPQNLPDRVCEKCDYLANMTLDPEEPNYECRRFAVEQVYCQETATWHVGHPKIYSPPDQWCGEFKRTSRPLPIPNQYPYPTNGNNN